MLGNKVRSWMVLVLIGAAIPLVYFAVRSGGSSESTRRLELERSTSVAAVGREGQEHELAALARELDKNPDHTPVLLRMAQLSRGLGKPAEAIRYLRTALEFEPGDQDARLELGRVLYESGDINGAIDETARLLELEPENVDALYNLGAIYGNLMDDARARELWERAVAVDPESQSGRMAAMGLEKLSFAPLRAPGREAAGPDSRVE